MLFRGALEVKSEVYLRNPKPEHPAITRDQFPQKTTQYGAPCAV